MLEKCGKLMGLIDFIINISYKTSSSVALMKYIYNHLNLVEGLPYFGYMFLAAVNFIDGVNRCYHRTDATSGAGTTDPYGVHESTPSF
jgi:hypothetical protein